MTNKSAIANFNGAQIKISIKDDGSIDISPNSFNSVKQGLIDIAGENRICIDTGWNTRYLGYRVIKALNGESFHDSLIEQEAQLASKFLDEDNSGNVKITLENVAKVEAMISYDSKYYRSGNVDSYPDDKWLKELHKEFKSMPDYDGYRGSTAFWMRRIYEYFFKPESIYKAFVGIEQTDYFRFLIYNAVCAVDAENSTHINADGVGRIELTDRLVACEEDLLSKLKNTKEYPLIQLLTERTNPKGKYSPRTNFSFATKFCHYACFHIFEDVDIEYRDSYSIYDNVVSNALRGKHFNMKEDENFDADNIDIVEKYRRYQRLIDRIRNKLVSRNGFDHLIWYYYKGKGKNNSQTINKEI